MLYVEMVGICMFGDVMVVDLDIYIFDIFFMDQGSEYFVMDIKVGYVIIDGNKNKYVVMAINVQSFFFINIIVDCVGGDCFVLFGKG